MGLEVELKNALGRSLDVAAVNKSMTVRSVQLDGSLARSTAVDDSTIARSVPEAAEPELPSEQSKPHTRSTKHSFSRFWDQMKRVLRRYVPWI